jgi:putative YphP/YqiW family bacilliredoxin
MPYPEFFVAPMRDELTRLGIEELRSAADVDAAVAGTSGTLMVVVNSVCGCAAGKARPGLALALRHGARPDRMTSVFAGFDVDATDRARSYFRGVMPSSPSVALLKDGQLMYMLERHHIEVRSADQIAAELRSAFDKFCSNGNAGELQPQSTQNSPRAEPPISQSSESQGSHFLKIQTRT